MAHISGQAWPEKASLRNLLQEGDEEPCARWRHSRKARRPGLGGQSAQGWQVGALTVACENVTVFLMEDCGSMSVRSQPGKWKPLKVFRGPTGLLEENRGVRREGPLENAHL